MPRKSKAHMSLKMPIKRWKRRKEKLEKRCSISLTQNDGRCYYIRSKSVQKIWHKLEFLAHIFFMVNNITLQLRQNQKDLNAASRSLPSILGLEAKHLMTFLRTSLGLVQINMVFKYVCLCLLITGFSKRYPFVKSNKSFLVYSTNVR